MKRLTKWCLVGTIYLYYLVFLFHEHTPNFLNFKFLSLPITPVPQASDLGGDGKASSISERLTAKMEEVRKQTLKTGFKIKMFSEISEWPKSKQSNCWPRCARTTTWAVGCGMSWDPMMAKRLLSVWLGASPVWFKWQLLGKWHLRCKWHIGNVAFIFYFILVLVECPYLRPCPTLSTWHVSKSCWKASPFSSQFPWHRRSFTYPHGASISLRKRNMERKGDGRRTLQFKAHFHSFLSNGYEARREPIDVRFAGQSETIEPFSVQFIDGQNKMLIIQAIMALIEQCDFWMN